MQMFFLEAHVALTKKYERTGKGQLVKTPYPMTWEFTSQRETVNSLPQFEAMLIKHAALGHCLIKGQLSRNLVSESRAGSTDSSQETEFLVLDLDGLPEIVRNNPLASVDALLASLGMGDVSYIIQWSASYGIENNDLRAHVFILLDQPYVAPVLKQWLIQQNHSIPVLKDSMSLTKTGNAISWTLDVSACQNDKLIYIAPPVLKGIKDPLIAAGIPRIRLVKRAKATFKITNTIHATAINKDLTTKRVEELRALAGLPKRKLTLKIHGPHQVMVQPDSCTLTEMKQERGFVYFNINGGDSWAYYHPENNPDYILNFKGEPVYLTKDLLPDYWSQLTTAGVKTNSAGIAYLAFCDEKTSAYWIGHYDAAKDILDLSPAKTSTIVRDYAKQHGVAIGDFIPVWNLSFDPTDNVRVDFVNKTINTFSPSIYMKAVPRKITTIPKAINRVITHAMGGDQAIVDHFLNWCAFIIQKRAMTKTAWVLHGTEGTGKGILCNDILRPILGHSNTTMRRMEELNEQYNHFMKSTFLIVVDEVQTNALQNERGALAKMRNFITEPNVQIRMMYANAHEAPNYSNWIFNSNMADPVAIPKNDRRHNVAKYQPVKFVTTDKEMAQITKELQDFHDFLLYYPLDEEQAHSVIHTADRDTMITISESSIDTVSSRLLEGTFEFFMDQLPAGTQYMTNWNAKGTSLEDYKLTLRALLARTEPKTGKCSVSREELRVMFDFVIGSMPATPNKFTSLLKHHRIHIEKVWLDNKTVSGIKVVWLDLVHFQAYADQLVPPLKATVVPIVKPVRAKVAA